MRNSGRLFSILIIAAIFAAALFFLALGIVLLGLDRMEATQRLLQGIGQPEKLEHFAAAYLTPQRYVLLKLVCFLAGTLAALFGIYMVRQRERIAYFGSWLALELQQLQKALLEEFDSLSRWQLGLLICFLAALTIVQVYLLNWFPAHTDEAFSYVFFVNKGLLHVVGHYPLPNNHVLYNLICLPFEFLDLPPLLVMRLPTFFFSLLVATFLFGLVKKLSGFTAGFLAMAIFSSGVYSLYFAVHGRGYMLLTLLALVAGYAVLRFCQCYCRIFLVVFAVASALGFYTVPVFAYAFASLVVFGGCTLLFNRKMVPFWQFTAAAAAAGLLTLLLYSPIILTAGFGVFYGHDIQEIAGQNFRAVIGKYLFTIPDNYWGLGWLSLLLPLASFGLFWQRPVNEPSENRLLRFFLPWMVLSVLLWVVLPQVMPPGRTWLYWSLYVAWSLALLLAPLFRRFLHPQNLHYGLLLAGSLSWLGCETYSIHQKVRTGEIQVFWPLPPVIKEILESPATRVFAGHEYYDLLLQYEALRTSRPLQVDLYQFRPAPPYDYLLVSQRKTFPAEVDSTAYEKVFEDHQIRAYRSCYLPEDKP